MLHALAAEAAVVIENARLYQEAIQSERAAQELRIASEIQHALLPPDTFQSSAVELAASTTPCRSVGGDLFDYVPREEGALSLRLPTSPEKERLRPCSLLSCRACSPASPSRFTTPAQVCTRLNGPSAAALWRRGSSRCSTANSMPTAR